MPAKLSGTRSPSTVVSVHWPSRLSMIPASKFTLSTRVWPALWLLIPMDVTAVAAMLSMIRTKFLGTRLRSIPMDWRRLPTTAVARFKTRSMPASSLVFRENGDKPSVVDLLEGWGWSRAGSGTFNGQAVEIYEITTSAEGRVPASGIELPYVEDLNPVSFKERAMVSTTLNFVLKRERWSVDADGEAVLIESNEILKAKVE